MPTELLSESIECRVPRHILQPTEALWAKAWSGSSPGCGWASGSNSMAISTEIDQPIGGTPKGHTDHPMGSQRLGRFLGVFIPAGYHYLSHVTAKPSPIKTIIGNQGSAWYNHSRHRLIASYRAHNRSNIINQNKLLSTTITHCCNQGSMVGC